jgi:uncharacterized RDD family membrane protein YckC
MSPPSTSAERAQRRLRVLLGVAGALVAVGLAATVVIVGEFLLGIPTPGTWAYGVAMLAPLGFALLLLALLGVALARRRDALAASRPPTSADAPP